jgi:hypothetical protein
MKCRDVQDMLSEYMDDILDKEKKLLVSEHLKLCKNCSAELSSLMQAVSLLKKKTAVLPPPDFVLQVRKKIEERHWWKEALKIVFFPWYIKLPLEAVATVVIVCVLYFVYYEKEFVHMPKQVKEESIEVIADKPVLPELKKEIPLKDSSGKEIPPYSEIERRLAIQKSIMEKEEVSFKPLPEAKTQDEVTQERKRSYRVETTDSGMLGESVSYAPTMLGEGEGVQYDLAAKHTVILYPEVILTLKNPGKDILKIKIYVYTLEGKIIKESPFEFLKISIPFKKYPKLLEMLAREGFLSEFHNVPDQPIDKNIVILLKIKKEG